MSFVIVFGIIFKNITISGNVLCYKPKFYFYSTHCKISIFPHKSKIYLFWEMLADFSIYFEKYVNENSFLFCIFPYFHFECTIKL